MSLTCNLPWRHPVVILGVINLSLIWLFLFHQSVVLHEPAGRYPYPVMAVGAILFFWCPIYFVAHPEEMSRAFLNWPRRSRMPGDKPAGGFFRALGYLMAMATSVLVFFALLESLSSSG